MVVVIVVVVVLVVVVVVVAVDAVVYNVFSIGLGCINHGIRVHVPLI